MFDQDFWKELLADLGSSIIFATLTFVAGFLFIKKRKARINKKITDYVTKIVDDVEDKRTEETASKKK